MKTLSTIFKVVATGLMLAVAALFVVPLLPIENNIELRIVESGSMEPSIMTGAVVLIVPQSTYTIGDVITFKDNSARVPTTHRIVDIYEENGQTWFTTKGDANEEADTAAVPSADVVGSVLVDAPYAGYILDFSRQPLGFFFLIVVPALMIIFGEVEKIWNELRRKRGGQSAGKQEKGTLVSEPVEAVPEVTQIHAVNHTRMIDIATPVKYRFMPTLDLRRKISQTHSGTHQTPHLSHDIRGRAWANLGMSMLIGVVIVSLNILPSTLSYPHDQETALDNEFTATTLDFSVLSDGQEYTFVDGVLAGDEGGVNTTVTLEPGSVSVRYDLAVVVTGGNNPLMCDAIIASVDDPFTYAGQLTSLTASNVAFSVPWSLSLNLSQNGFVVGDTCAVEVVYTGWHFDVETDQGYFDEERTLLSFTVAPPQAAAFRTVLIAPLSLEVKEESAPVENEVSGGGAETEVVVTEDTTSTEEAEPVVEEPDVKEEVPLATEVEVEVAQPEAFEIITEDQEQMDSPVTTETTQPEVTEEVEEETDMKKLDLEVIEKVEEVVVEESVEGTIQESIILEGTPEVTIIEKPVETPAVEIVSPKPEVPEETTL